MCYAKLFQNSETWYYLTNQEQLDILTFLKEHKPRAGIFYTNPTLIQQTLRKVTASSCEKSWFSLVNQTPTFQEGGVTAEVIIVHALRPSGQSPKELPTGPRKMTRCRIIRTYSWFSTEFITFNLPKLLWWNKHPPHFDWLICCNNICTTANFLMADYFPKLWTNWMILWKDTYFQYVSVNQ